MTLIQNPEHLKPGHLWSVENQEINPEHRKKTILPGHMVGPFINNPQFHVMYIGLNSTEWMT